MIAKHLLYDLFQDVLWTLDKDLIISRNKIREFNLNDQKEDSQYEQRVFDALSKTTSLIVGIVEGVEDDYFDSKPIEVDQ